MHAYIMHSYIMHGRFAMQILEQMIIVRCKASASLCDFATPAKVARGPLWPFVAL
jgi:hypothetical protein